MRKFVALILLSFAVFAMGPAWAAKLTLQQAIAKVERDTRGKVLSAETKHYGIRTIYRIKVLTRDGKVKVIEVPADDAKSTRTS
jgi:uncharacterized membrane protein YkoI